MKGYLQRVQAQVSFPLTGFLAWQLRSSKRMEVEDEELSGEENDASVAYLVPKFPECSFLLIPMGQGAVV